MSTPNRSNSSQAAALGKIGSHRLNAPHGQRVASDAGRSGLDARLLAEIDPDTQLAPEHESPDGSALRAAAARLVAESREAQGLPRRINDPAVIGRIAALVATQAARGSGEVGR